MAISAGLTTLTVTWDSPTDNSAATYTVRLFTDQNNDATTTFAAGAVRTYGSMPWNNDPTVTTGSLQYNSATRSYTFTTPNLRPGTGDLALGA